MNLLFSNTIAGAVAREIRLMAEHPDFPPAIEGTHYKAALIQRGADQSAVCGEPARDNALMRALVREHRP